MTTSLLEEKMQSRVRPQQLALKSALFNRQVSTVRQLRRHVTLQRYLPQDLSDLFLSHVLRACGHDLDLAGKLLKKYFYARQDEPQLFGRRDPLCPDNLQVLTSVYVLPLGGAESQAPVVLLVGMTDFDPRKCVLQDWSRLLFLTMDLVIQEPCWTEKFLVVLDGTGLVINHFRTFQEDQLTSVARHLRESLVAKIEEVHCINVPLHLIPAVGLFNDPWFHVHNHLETLHCLLPRSSLPDEYGGTAGPLQQLLYEWKTKFLQVREWLLKEDELREEEANRRRARDQYKVEYQLREEEDRNRKTERLTREMEERWRLRMLEVSEELLPVVEMKKGKNK